MRSRVSICTLIIGLICPFTQVARERRAAGAIWDDWRKVRRCSRTPFRIGPANATAFRQWRSWLRWGGFEPPTFGVIIPLLLATLVGQLTDSQVPDQFELLAPIGPPIPVVCEHFHV
jgi:hypothetical protein